MNARLARWLELLSEYDFEIKHIKGKDNNVVDVLNKKLHMVVISECKSDIRERILKVINQDGVYIWINEQIQKGKKR